MVMCSAPWYSNTRRRSWSWVTMREVDEEDADAHEALDQPEQEAVAEPALEQAGEEQRREEEEADGEGEGDDERDADLLLAELLPPPRRATRWRRW